MENLKKSTLISILKPLLKQSSTLRDNLSEFLLNRDLTNLEYEDSQLLRDVGNEIFIQLDEIPSQLTTDLTRHLFDILNGEDWVKFNRLVQTMNELPVWNPVDKNRLSAYLKEIKFTTHDSIDLEKSAKALSRKLDPVGIGNFVSLKEEQKNVLEILSQEQIEALLNFNSKAIGILSKFMHIPDDQRNIILTMTNDEIRVLKDMTTPFKSHTRLNLQPDDVNKVLNFHEQHLNILDVPVQVRPLISKISQYTPTEKLALRKFLERGDPRWDIYQDGIDFIEHLTMEEISQFKQKSEQQKNIFKDFNTELLNELVKFDTFNTHTLRQVLRRATKLEAEERNAMFLLTSEQLRPIWSGMNVDDLSLFLHLGLKRQAHMNKVKDLDPIENEVLTRMDEAQRKILSKLYVLCFDGMKIIHDLGPIRAYETISMIRDERDLSHFDIKQKILLKRIERLSEDDRNKILSVTLNEFNTFDKLSRLAPGSKALLMNLSKDGMNVLKRMENLSKNQIDFIYDLNDNKIMKLAQNARLGPDMIDSLRQLDRNEAKFLIKLTLNQRHQIMTKSIDECSQTELFNEDDMTHLRNLNRRNKPLLDSIVHLTNQERAQLSELSEDEATFVSLLEPEVNRLFAILNKNEFQRMSNVLNWRREEEVAFGLLKLPLRPSTELQTIKGLFQSLSLQMQEQEGREEYMKFIASIVTNCRTTDLEFPNIISTTTNALSEVYTPSFVLEFNIQLLNFCAEDKLAMTELTNLFSKVVSHHDGVTKLREMCHIAGNEIPFLFQWMLSNPIEKHQELSYDITRQILRRLTLNPNVNILKAILATNGRVPYDSLKKGLQKQLKDEGFLLTHDLFFNENPDITKWLSQVLNPQDMFEFLNSPKNYRVLSAHHEHGTNQQVLNNLNVLEFSLYYNRGFAYTFLNELNPHQLEALMEKNPTRLLHYIVQGGHIEAVRIFEKRLGTERLLSVVNNNRDKIFHSIDNHFGLTTHRLNNFAQTIQWFAEKDSNHEFYVPLQIKLASHATQEISDQTEFDRLIDSLATEHLDRNQLLLKIGIQRPPNREQAGPSCFDQRNKRHVSPSCMDSTDTETMTVEEKQHLIRTLFETLNVENNELYQLMSLISDERTNTVENMKRLREKLSSVESDSIHPDIQEILNEMKSNVGDEEKLMTIVKKPGVATKIQKFAERTGMAFTIFLLGKHLCNGNVEALGYDAVNLWLLPKAGDKVAQTLLALGSKLNSRIIGGFAPILGRSIGNFGAFVGLEQAIRDRKHAREPLDIEIADLNIVTNTVFIVADIPGVVTGILASAEVATGTVGEFAGPIGWAASVSVLVVSGFIEAALKYNDLSGKIKLTTHEKIRTFWDFLWGRELPEYITRDIESKNIYQNYASKIIEKFHKDYEMIGISLPNIVLTKEEYATPESFIHKLAYNEKCKAENRTVDTRIDFSSKSLTKNPFFSHKIHHISKLLPPLVKTFSLVCGPKADDVERQSSDVTNLAPLPSDDCGNKIMRRITEKWAIPQRNNDDCGHVMLYKNQSPTTFGNILFHLSQDSIIQITKTYPIHPIDVIFSGKTISIIDNRINTLTQNTQPNKYHFTQETDNCKIYKKGVNVIYIKHNGSFACDLGDYSKQQSNIAVIQGVFKDIRNIHSIIGSSNSDRINVSHAEYVDGGGGSDTIGVQNFTTVQSHYGDVIHGKTMTLLPMNVSEINKIITNHRTTVYNRSNQTIQVDADSFLQTNDGFLISPRKINNVTNEVTHLYVYKNIDSNIVLRDELAVLNLMKTTQYNCTKHITSWNQDILLSDTNHNMFYTDKNNYNYYWETSDLINHLYIFDMLRVNITISKAHGILDFMKFNVKNPEQKLKIVKQPEGEMHLYIKDVQINLLKNRQLVRVTFDRKQYFRIEHGILERDYCTHSFKVDGKLIINGESLSNHHNCFEFQSDKMIFVRSNDNLLLLSGINMLTITDFYTVVDENIDLSLKTSSIAMKPEEFRQEADNSSSFRFYKIIDNESIIYHNQPSDENLIGVVYLNNSSILDHDLELRDQDLHLINQNVTVAKLMNWNNRQAAREVMFAFNDALMFNPQCVLFNCIPKYTLKEFRNQKKQVNSSAASRRKRDLHLDHVENIVQNDTHHYLDPFNRLINLALLFFQNYLDKRYSLPQFRDISPGEMYLLARNIVEKFEEKMTEISRTRGMALKNWDSFELYTDIVQHLRNENYSQIPKTLASVEEKLFHHSK